MTSNATVIGLLADCSLRGANLPQVWKTYRVKSGEGLSFSDADEPGYRTSLWIVYGCLSHRGLVIVANALGLLLIASLLTMKLKYDQAPTKD